MTAVDEARGRQVGALRDVARAALAFARHLEGGGKVPFHLERTSYAQATARADEQLRGEPDEAGPCECVLPLVFGGDLLPPRPDCTACQGTGVIEHWTPALGSQPLLFDVDAAGRPA